jgi:hypothetical protein
MQFKQVFDCLMMSLKNMDEFSIGDVASINPKKFFRFIPDDKRIYKKSRSLENKMRLSFSQTPRISESVERFLFARELV